MKKRTVALLLALVLVFGVAVGGTIAWLTSSASVTNTFTTGDVDITLDETDTDNSTEGENDRDTENSYKLMPGGEYDKDPQVHVTAGSEDCYVYVTVSNDIADYEANTTEKPSILTQMAANDWIVLRDSENNPVKLGDDIVYVYAPEGTPAIVEAGTNLNVFEKLYIAGDAALENLSTKDIVVNAYAIQSENMGGSALTAWTNGSSEWGGN